MRHVTDARRFVEWSQVGTKDPVQSRCELVQAGADPAPDVENLARSIGMGRRSPVCVHHVRDIREIPGLLAGAINYGLLPPEETRGKTRNDGCVFRLGILAGAENIEVTESHGLQAENALKKAGILFRDSLA